MPLYKVVDYRNGWHVAIEAEHPQAARSEGASVMETPFRETRAYLAEYRNCPQCGDKDLYLVENEPDTVCWRCYEDEIERLA